MEAKDKILTKIKTREDVWKEKTLAVDCTKLSLKDWRYFCRILKTNKTVQSLLIDGELSKSFARILAQNLKANNHLFVLNLASVQESGMKYLRNILEAKKLLMVLVLGERFTFGSKESLKMFCNSIKYIQMLHVKLADGHIGEEIAKSLKDATSLSDLNFVECENYGTGLSKKAFRRLAEALEVNTSLQLLSLPQCGVDDEDCARLTAALAKNSSLRHLTLQSDYMTPKSYSSIANLLKVNTTLIDLTFQVSGLPDKADLHPFKEAMMKNTTLQSLTIPATLDELEAVADILKVNSSLTSVNLNRDDNFFVEEAGRLLCAALKNNESVRSLEFWTDEDEGDTSATESMAELLRTNKAITNLGTVSEERPKILKRLAKNKKVQDKHHRTTLAAMGMISSSKQALKIFPKEIWLNIFKFVKFPGRDYHAHFDETLNHLFMLNQPTFSLTNMPTDVKGDMLLSLLNYSMGLKQKTDSETGNFLLNMLLSDDPMTL